MVDRGARKMILLVTFHSVGNALQAQTLLAKHAVRCTVIPVPRRVSSSCGYALEASGMAASSLAAAMDAAGVEWDAVYRQSGEETEDRYELAARRESGGKSDV